MDLEQAQAIVNQAVYAQRGRYLSDIEQLIFAGAWQGKTYEQIAEENGYSVKYLKDDGGRKFWKLLSQVLGEPVGKSNFRAAILRRRDSANERLNQRSDDSSPMNDQSKSQAVIASESHRSRVQTDWGEMIDVSQFYGRSGELMTLMQWIMNDRCRVIALLGMGGIGKTALSVKLANQLLINSNIQGRNEFEFVVWRSLRNAPLLEMLLSDLVPLLSNQQDTQNNLNRFMHCLRSHRCLVILDNMESILQGSERAGQFRGGYENYGELLRLASESNHQSCVVLTSREKPAEVAAFEGIDFKVRSLQLGGSEQAAQAIVQAKGLIGSNEQKQELCNRYSNSPLAIKIVSTFIQDLFEGDIDEFLRQDTAIFSGIRRLLDQQFNRLSPLEQTIMYWLAINREWTAVAELYTDIIPAVSKAKLLESLESLNWRSLIEKRAGSYMQQSVVMEYVTERLIEKVAAELNTTELDLFISHALIKTTVKEYVQDSQERLILQPLAGQISRSFSSKVEVEQRLLRILTKLRQLETAHSGYGTGNLLNLFGYLRQDLTNYNFSDLTISHAHLQHMNLHGVNFGNAHFIKSAFRQAFGITASVAINFNGELLAVGDGTGGIYVWRISSNLNAEASRERLLLDLNQPFLALKGHSNCWIWSVSFSPDGQMLASGSEDRTIKLWDIGTGDCLTCLEGHSSLVTSVAFSPDGQTLVSSSGDLTIRLWDVATGQCLRVFQGHNHQVRSVAFSSNGKLIASASDDQTVILWDIATGQALKTLQGHTSQVWSIAFSPDSRTIASGSIDHTVRLWETSTGQCLKLLQGHTSQVWSVAFSPDSRTIASGSDDSNVRLWDVGTGQCLKILQGHINAVWSVTFHPDGQILVSGSEDQTVKLWNLHTGKTLRTFQGYGIQLWSVVFSPDGQTLVSGGTESIIRFWNISTGQTQQSFQNHTHWISSLAFSPDGQVLASGSADKTIKLWDVNTSHCLKTWQGHTAWVTSVNFSSSGQLLVSSGFDQVIKLWDLESEKCLHSLQGHTSWVWSTAISPNDRLIASGSFDKTIKLWNVNTGGCLQTLCGHTNWVWSVVFSPNSQWLASSSNDKTIRLWDVSTGQCLKILEGHTNQIFQVRFSPDGQLLVSGSTDRTIKLWDVSTGQCLKTLSGHTSQVRSVAFSPNGQIIASCGADETIKLWEVQTGRCLKSLRAARPYEGMNITGITGVTEAQKATLKALGAIE